MKKLLVLSCSLLLTATTAYAQYPQLTDEAKKLIEELKAIRGNSDQQSRDRINEIAKWFENNKTEENLKLLNDFIDKGIEEMEAEIEDIKRCIEEDHP